MASFTHTASRSRAQCRETLMSPTFEIVLNTGRRDIVVVAMDAGNEIDDEIAAHLLMKHFDKGHIVFFAQVPGAKIGGGDKEAMERVNRMRKVFPKSLEIKIFGAPRFQMVILPAICRLLSCACWKIFSPW